MSNIQLHKNLNPSLSKPEIDIVLASKEKKVRELPKQQVLNKLAEFITLACIVLNTKSDKVSKTDIGIFSEQIYNDLYSDSKFISYTLGEVQMAFYYGTRGQLKNRPDEIVFVAIAQIYQWLVNYIEFKREAMKKQIDFEAQLSETISEKERSHKENLMKQSIIEAYENFLKGQPIYDPVGAIYLFLDNRGLIKITPERKREIYKEEIKKFTDGLIMSDGKPKGRDTQEIIKNKRLYDRLQEFKNDLQKLPKEEIDPSIIVSCKLRALEITFSDLKELGMSMQEYLDI